MGGKYTEAQKKAAIKYLQEKTDNIQLRTSKGTKERWRVAAEAMGLPLTQFVAEAVEEKIKQMRKN